MQGNPVEPQETTGIGQTTEFFQPEDGRTLAYAEYGATDGIPLFFFHGAPGCRLPVPASVDVARDLGLRIIATDHPGYGQSDPAPNLTLLGWASNMAALADHLGIDRFAVLGNSGGGCYAAACAAKLRGRILATSLVGCPPPPDLSRLRERMPLRYRLFQRIGAQAPWLLRIGTTGLSTAHHIWPQLYITLLTQIVDENDRRLVRDPENRRWMVERRSEAYRQGGKGQAQDLKLLCRDWGFVPSEMAGAIDLWQGEGDQLIPEKVMQLFADSIPKGRLCKLEGGGHLMLTTTQHWQQVLGRLVKEIQ